jgi:hypothetical protein
MPFSHLIRQAEQTALVVAEGSIDLQSSVAAMVALATDPDFQPTFRVIVDLRRMKYSPRTKDLFGIRDALTSLRQAFQGGVTLVVHEAALYLARLVCVLAGAKSFEMTAVTTLEAAAADRKEA